MPRSLEEVIGYRFLNPGLLKQAMSHKSFASEKGSGVDNERLEFLGDSVLASVIAHAVYASYPEEPEGILSKKKSLLVSRSSLALWGEAVEIGAYLHLGVGEESSGGRTRQSLLANAVEALIGAIYLDGGYLAAMNFIQAWYAERHGSLLETDHKSRLQEILQKRHKSPPTYETLSAIGPEHDKVFVAVVRVGDNELGRGKGKSKKQSEQAAADAALRKMGRGESR